MERYKLQTLLMSDEDVRVLQESLLHTAEGKAVVVSVPDRKRAQDLYDRIVEKFKGEER